MRQRKGERERERERGRERESANNVIPFSKANAAVNFTAQVKAHHQMLRIPRTEEEAGGRSVEQEHALTCTGLSEGSSGVWYLCISALTKLTALQPSDELVYRRTSLHWKAPQLHPQFRSSLEHTKKVQPALTTETTGIVVASADVLVRSRRSAQTLRTSALHHHQESGSRIK
ncbi:hypothetical protein SRHO_G00150430 [Serrasalmus rhombeus]